MAKSKNLNEPLLQADKALHAAAQIGQQFRGKPDVVYPGPDLPVSRSAPYPPPRDAPWYETQPVIVQLASPVIVVGPLGVGKQSMGQLYLEQIKTNYVGIAFQSGDKPCFVPWANVVSITPQ